MMIMMMMIIIDIVYLETAFHRL